MNLFLGRDVPEDMFVLFADLTAYKCASCDSLIATGVADTGSGSSIVAECGSLVDSFGRPVGLVCLDCLPNFKEFHYKD